MKSIMKKILLLLLISLLLFSCTEKNYDNSSHLEDNVNNDYLDDYDYLWTSLEESYPFFGVLERSGVDWEELKKEYREMISNSELDDLAFSNLLNQMINQFRGTGHIHVMDRDYYHQVRYLYSDAKMTEWTSILETPQSVIFYNYDENHFDVNASFENGNIDSYLIEDEGIAYINIKSFKHQNIELEQGILFDLYDQIESYDHLIIDIRENQGGDTSYFSKNIVEPLINDSLYTESYMLYSENDYNKPFIESILEVDRKLYENELSHGHSEILTSDQMPEFEMINESDLLKFNKVRKYSTHYNPSNEFEFNGRIWVLVGEKVYSSSEAFAQMCINTGFATLVGHPTGGDGVGIDPILVSLPKTGIIVRFSTLYGLNVNGQNNEEFGTTPDILIESYESAFEKVLELIREGQ